MLTGAAGSSCIFYAVSFQNAPLILKSIEVADDNEVRRLEDHDFAVAIVAQCVGKLQRIKHVRNRFADIEFVFVFIVVRYVVAVPYREGEIVAAISAAA